MMFNTATLHIGLKILAESIDGWDSPIIFVVLFGIVGLIWFGIFSVITLIGISLSKVWQKRQINNKNLFKSNDSLKRVIFRLFIVFISVILYWIIGEFMFETFNLTSISQRDELIIIPYVFSSVIFVSIVHYYMCIRTMKPIRNQIN